MHQILLLNGPNLNLLGQREPEVYGSSTLDDVINQLKAVGQQLGCDIRDRQSNVEGELVDALHDAQNWADGVVFNPGAYAHTSIALRDAISGTGLPVVETHISNIHAREKFRHHSMLAGVCIGTVAGFGVASYEMSLAGLLRHLNA